MSPVERWLRPIAMAAPEVRTSDWTQLRQLDAHLTRLAVEAPASDATQADRSRWLLDVRRDLASHGYVSTTWHPIAQAMAQFVCGHHDLDLRDATGLGQGALVLRAPASTRAEWLARLEVGELVGIAATERHGGTRIQEITTCAALAPEGTWEVSGEKVWVSRLCEADGFVVFFRDPDHQISAAVISADAPGLCREPIRPAGLAGWTWGVLRFNQVPIDPLRDLIGRAGEGLTIFRQHFSQFRPLVSATALGAAAAAHSFVADTLRARVRVGMLPRIRDHALITLGRAYVEINAAVLATVHAARLSAVPSDDGYLWSRLGKAHAVGTAHRAVAELTPLVGASGFQANGSLVKAQADLTGLLYADGIHDSLFRSGGKHLTGDQAATVPGPTSPGIPMPRSDGERAAP